MLMVAFRRQLVSETLYMCTESAYVQVWSQSLLVTVLWGHYICCILVSQPPPAHAILWPVSLTIIVHFIDLAHCTRRYCWFTCWFATQWAAKQLNDVSLSINTGALTPRLYFFYRERGFASPGAKLFCSWRIMVQVAKKSFLNENKRM